MTIGEAKRIPCPFTYAKGKPCTGHVVRIEAYKADLQWTFTPAGWRFNAGAPRSHYHLFCSEKGNHAGWRDDAVTFYYDELPEDLKAVVLEP